MTVTEAEVVKSSPVTGEPDPARGHFVFENVTWEFYQQTREQLERGGQHAHVTFDEGRMEIMTTTGWHEGIKKAVARLLEHYSFVKDIPIQGFGNVTFDREDLAKGLEPDECYYVAKKIVLDEKGHLDLLHGPPPDLVIEVEVPRSSVPKRPLYIAMGVPEVWAFSAERIEVLKLDEKKYNPILASRYFPDLDLKEFFRFVQIAQSDQHEGVKAFDTWLRGTGATK
jgi:Uma2 family endonuclease